MSTKKRVRSERTVESLPLTTLPFVTRDDLRRPHYWTVDPVDEHFQAQIEAEALAASTPSSTPDGCAPIPTSSAWARWAG